VARYRHRDEIDLGWNKIRRRITAEIDIEMRNVREEILNVALWKAWEDYAAALGEGRVPEIEGQYTRFVSAILGDVTPRIVAAAEVKKT